MGLWAVGLGGVGVLASGDRRGLKPITELGWGAGGAMGDCVRDMRWGGRVLYFARVFLKCSPQMRLLNGESRRSKKANGVLLPAI